MNEIAIQKILRYLDECLIEPKRNWPNYIFEERSYSRWAAFEIIQLLIDHPFDPPDIVIEKFLLKMTMFSSIEENSKRYFMFSTAKNTAEDILSIISKGENYE